MRRLLRPTVVVAAVVLTACAPPATSEGPTRSSPPASSSEPSRLILAMQNDVSVLASKLQVGPGVSGGIGEDHRFMSNSPLVVLDSQGTAQPRLAAQVPSREQGTWTLNPDGTMATTWRLRPNAAWHDGQPVTPRDFVFALQVYLDPEIAVVNRHPERLVDRIDPLDDQTFAIYWKQLYVWANRLLGEQLEPLPEHLLGPLYARGDKVAFQNAPFWTSTSYVGNGPYVLVDRVEGVERIYRAFDRYYLGRPRIDEVIVRFLSDQNTVLANVLSGAVDATTSSTLNQQSGAILKQEWDRTGEGRLLDTLSSFIFGEFQQHPERAQPSALLDLRVRRAITHGIDRVALNEVSSTGRAPTPEVPMHPDDPLYPRVLQAISSYPFDPGRALNLLEEGGWSKRGDRLADANGEPFRLDIKTVARSDNELRVRIMASYLSALGMEISQTVLSVAEDADREQRARFPGMGLHTVGTMEVPEGLADFTSEECARPENRFAGRNRRCWSNPEFDRLFRFATTTPDEQVRSESTVQMLKLLTEDAAVVPLTYSIHNMAVRKGLVGPVPRWHAQRGTTWNIHEWRWS